MRVYIAGPISKGPLEANIRRALDAANILIANGFYPYIPHLACFMEITYPQTYERWLSIGFSYITVCEAVLRLEGESAGADRECDFAESFQIPVFYSIITLIEWRNGKQEKVRELARDVPRLESPQI